MLLNDQRSQLDYADVSCEAARNGMGWRRSMLNPFRLVLRITEYLAGPPVHEEISALQDEAEKWRQRTAALERECEDLHQRVGDLQNQLERVKQRESHVTKERDQVRDYAAQLKNERDDLRQQRTALAQTSNLEFLSQAEKWRTSKAKACVKSLRDRLDIDPGTFALLNEDGDSSGYGWNLLSDFQGQVQGAGSIFESAQKAVYDPVTDQVLFCGAPHGVYANKLLRYDVARNKWAVEPAPATWGTGCAYDTNTINLAVREMYVSSTVRANCLRRLNLDNHKWSSMAQPHTIGFSPSEPSAEYFPERDELLWLQMKRLASWKPSADRWTLVSPALQGLRWRSAIARYNPVSQCILILGGADTDKKPAIFSKAVYRYDRNGIVTRLKDAPPSIKIYINHAVVTVDPVSGDFLVIQAVHGSDATDFTGEIEFWKYRMDTDTWTQLDESVIPAPAGWWAEKYPSAVLAAPIPKYGVILFMSAAPASKSKVYLYKHC